MALAASKLEMEIRPISLRAACAFVAAHHRHNKPPRGHKFSLAVHLGDELVGVAIAGRPISRHFDDGFTLEISRTCTTGTPNANSMLYGACRRAAWAMGYTRLITYSQAAETGASLRAAGFMHLKLLPARENWAGASVKLKHLRDASVLGGVVRNLWEARR